jgi:hypothetical protein
MPITDGLRQAIRKAGLDLLRADLGPPALVVFDSLVPPNTAVGPGYVLVYFYLERPHDNPGNAVDGRSRTYIAHWICHCVSGGTDGIAAEGVSARVEKALLDQRPTVPGFNAASVGTFELESSTPPGPTESTGVLVMDCVNTYSLRVQG